MSVTLLLLSNRNDMPWTIAFHDAALAEANALSADIRARLNRMVLVIVRVFVKKTQKTPPHEIKLAQKRAGEV